MSTKPGELQSQEGLSLARRKGRPVTSNKDEWKQIAVGARVSRLRDDGLSYEEAVAQVAEERYLSESSVKRYYKKCLNLWAAFQRVKVSCSLIQIPSDFKKMTNGLAKSLRPSSRLAASLTGILREQLAGLLPSMRWGLHLIVTKALLHLRERGRPIQRIFTDRVTARERFPILSRTVSPVTSKAMSLSSSALVGL